MDLEKLHKKLLNAARQSPPADSVPYAFEKRIMARLTARPETDVLAFWTRALWQAAVSCVAIMLLLSALSVFYPSGHQSLAEDFETTLVAGLNLAENGW
jgi:hypothetical protein